MPPEESLVREKLREVVDPEFGRSIVDKGLIDDVRIEGGAVEVTYHLTVPFCPYVFAMHIGKEIRKKVLQIPGVENVRVRVKDHIQTEQINKELQEGE
jgi:ATP-binding protein involved in chromosome partitioning